MVATTTTTAELPQPPSTDIETWRSTVISSFCKKLVDRPETVDVRRCARRGCTDAVLYSPPVHSSSTIARRRATACSSADDVLKARTEQKGCPWGLTSSRHAKDALGSPRTPLWRVCSPSRWFTARDIEFQGDEGNARAEQRDRLRFLTYLTLSGTAILALLVAVNKVRLEWPQGMMTLGAAKAYGAMSAALANYWGAIGTGNVLLCALVPALVSVRADLAEGSRRASPRLFRARRNGGRRAAWRSRRARPIVAALTTAAPLFTGQPWTSCRRSAGVSEPAGISAELRLCLLSVS